MNINVSWLDTEPAVSLGWLQSEPCVVISWVEVIGQVDLFPETTPGQRGRSKPRPPPSDGPTVHQVLEKWDAIEKVRAGDRQKLAAAAQAQTAALQANASREAADALAMQVLQGSVNSRAVAQRLNDEQALLAMLLNLL